MSPGHPILPFDELLWPKFEAFMFETLASGLRVELPAGTKSPARVYRVVRADPYGSDGHKQKGIDFYCTMDDGSEWVLQAKLTPKFGLAKARAAVKKARRKFPKARRYITREPEGSNIDIWSVLEERRRLLGSSAPFDLDRRRLTSVLSD